MPRFAVWTLGLALVTTACGKKDEPVVTPTPTQTGPTAGGAPTGNADDAARRAEEARRDSLARAEAARAGLVNEMATMIHFDYDSYAIRSSDQALLNRKGEILRANPAARIRVVGHADDRGSDEYNLALGMRRATAAKEYLVRLGIEAGRIEVASLGEEVPLDTSATESAWAANRRGEFEIIAGNQTLRTP